MRFFDSPFRWDTLVILLIMSTLTGLIFAISWLPLPIYEQQGFTVILGLGVFGCALIYSFVIFWSMFLYVRSWTQDRPL